jgi:cytoskeletal protein CcmA (bactofilin family)
MVGEGMTVAGPVIVRDSLMVFGHLRAGVKATGENSVLLLREGSVVLGEVIGTTVLVKGNVRGNIQGKTVRLYAGCRVLGQIRAETLIVDDGATIYNRSVQANAKGVDPAEATSALQQEAPMPIDAPLSAEAPRPVAGAVTSAPVVATGPMSLDTLTLVPSPVQTRAQG